MQRSILHIIPRFIIGGAERLILDYTRQRDKHKVDVAVASVRGAGELLGQFDCPTVTRDVLGFVKQWRPDIVHTHMLSSDLAGHIIKRRDPRIAWISTQHNVEYHASWPRQWLWPRILRRADAVIAVSRAVEGFCRSVWDVPQERLRLIPNGIALSEWLAVPAEGATVGALRLATVGRLETQKGHDVLFRALGALVDEVWTLDVFGDGRLRQSLGKLAHLCGIADRVRFRGVANNLAAEYATVDVVVQPSRWEGRSLVVMEAMAAGRCLVASVPAAAELVEHEKTGLVVPAVDVHELAHALRRLLLDRPLIARLGNAARDQAREHFGMDAWVAAIDALYASV